jgi:hypothetical protein
VRVLVDWIVELFFPRDIVQTLDFKDGQQEPAELAVRPQADQSKQSVSMTAH